MLIEEADISKFIDEVSVVRESFNNFEASEKGFLSMIYQSGYLTIKSYDKDLECYTLKVPNDEVKKGFYKSLLPRFSCVELADLGLQAEKFRRALRETDMCLLQKLISSSIANLPYLTKKDIYEDMYRNVLHMLFTIVGYQTTSESLNICGRADTVVVMPDKVYIFEYKMQEGKDLAQRAAEALSQIDLKHYADRFDATGKQIIKVALVFNDDLSGLGEMASEIVN